MKKLLSLIICFELASLSAFSEITDDFADKTLDKTLKIKPYEKIEISDTFAENSLNKNLKIKSRESKTISDSFAENNKNKNPKFKKLVVFDSSSMTPVYVRIKNPFTSKDEIQEGEIIKFELTKETVIRNKLYPAGSTVKSRLETVSLNAIMGVPSDVVLGNFSIDEIPLEGEINKVGANRSLWVYPSVHILNCLFCLGLLLIPIRGGHAKIKTSEVFTLYAQ